MRDRKPRDRSLQGSQVALPRLVPQPVVFAKRLHSLSFAPQEPVTATASIAGSSYLKLPAPLMWITGNIGLHHVHHLGPKIPNYRLQQAHDENPFFHNVTILTLKDTGRALTLALWDEEREKLVSFKDLARREIVKPIDQVVELFVVVGNLHTKLLAPALFQQAVERIHVANNLVARLHFGWIPLVDQADWQFFELSLVDCQVSAGKLLRAKTCAE